MRIPLPVANGRALGALRLLFPSLSLILAIGIRKTPIHHQKERQMPTGTVKFFNESKGFGFIQPEGGGADAFVHISDVERSGMSTLRENQRVSYDVEQDQRGKMKACNLKSADGE
jgi:CspA family cold shock protein